MSYSITGNSDSGACCPGLIEASLLILTFTLLILDSGACCPGLIEARGGVLLDWLPQFGFRGLLPWPH